MTMNDDFLDAALKRQTQAPATDDAAVARVLARLAGPLPRQKRPFWRLPTVLLDWQFAPAWPRLAALGACAALGFFIGIAGIDRPIGGFTLSNSTTGAGFGAVLFEPEAVTGAQP
jgi:hypothetical protein